MSALDLELDGSSYAPGETVRGRATWSLDADPESLELHLLWFTMGKGDQDIGVVRSLPLPPSRSGSHDFALELPAGPWSFSGKLVSLLWAVELVAGPDLGTQRVEIVVAPDRREVLLHAGA